MVAVAMIPENPVVGGTVLRRAAIQSPNFVHNSSGWIISQDGSAEFNNVVIRNGQVVSGTALFYSSLPPASGNLIASISSASGTDSAGNAYLAGVTSYVNAAPFQAANLQSGELILLTAPGAGGPWTVKASVSFTANLLNLATQFGSGAGINISPDPGQLINMTKTLIQDSVTGGNVLLELVNLASATAPLLRVTTNAAGDLFFGGRVSGDTNSRVVLDVTAGGNPRVRLGPGNAAPDIALSRVNANQLQLATADLDIATVGRGLQVAEGANARMGRAVLAAGTVTVSNTTVTAATEIFLTCQVPGGTPGFLRVSARTAGASFTILSSSGTDTSTVAWLLLEPG